MTTELIEIDELADQIAEQALAGAGRLTGPIETLHYCSHLVSLWEGGQPVLGRELSDAIGLCAVQALARCERLEAQIVIGGVASVAESPVSEAAAQHVATFEPAPGAPPPAWLHTLDQDLFVRAGRIEEPADDATTVLVDLAWPSGLHAGLGVFIDRRLGGIAKHILVGPSIADCVEELRGGGCRRPPFESLSGNDAAALINAAIEASEAGDLIGVGDTYVSQRALLRSRLRRIERAVPRSRAA